MVSTSSPPLRDLFGGALRTTLPGNVIDVSDLRQVPDTQEVFVFPDSDVSIVFEILQIVQEGEAVTDLRKAVEYHFKSIAHDNAALSTTIDTISSPFPLPSSLSSSASSGGGDRQGPHNYITLEGVQIVSKFNLPESESDLVKIFLCLVRIDLNEPSKADPSLKRGADITICINVPLGRVKDIDRQAGSLPDSTKALEVQAKGQFEKAVRDFVINDYELFA